jgi:hypothetical protein
MNTTGFSGMNESFSMKRTKIWGGHFGAKMPFFLTQQCRIL